MYMYMYTYMWSIMLLFTEIAVKINVKYVLIPAIIPTEFENILGASGTYKCTCCSHCPRMMIWR